MSRRLPRLGPVAITALFFFSFSAPVAGQEQLASNAIIAPVGVLPEAVSRATLFPSAPSAAAEATLAPARQTFAPPVRSANLQGDGRPVLLPALYATTIALQALDAHSTMTGLKQGAVEANPLMKGAAGSPATLLAVKAAAAASTIFFAEKLWKRNRVAAVVLMAAVNGVTAAVVAHNYKVVSQLR